MLDNSRNAESIVRSFVMMDFVDFFPKKKISFRVLFEVADERMSIRANSPLEFFLIWRYHLEDAAFEKIYLVLYTSGQQSFLKEFFNYSVY